ncbi:MAG: hypothetical protein AAF267_00125 [Deinococcota bacterium]
MEKDWKREVREKREKALACLKEKKDWKQEVREKREEALAHLKEKKARHLVFVYATDSSWDTSVSIHIQLAWDDTFTEVSLPQHFYAGCQSHIWHVQHDIPGFGTFSLDIQTGSLLMIGKFKGNYEKRVVYTSSGEDVERERPVFELLPNYKDIYEAGCTDWTDDTALSRLYDIATSEDEFILRALAVNHTTPDYILAQIAKNSEFYTHLIRLNPNCPDWL